MPRLLSSTRCLRFRAFVCSYRSSAQGGGGSAADMEPQQCSYFVPMHPRMLLFHNSRPLSTCLRAHVPSRKKVPPCVNSLPDSAYGILLTVKIFFDSSRSRCSLRVLVDGDTRQPVSCERHSVRSIPFTSGIRIFPNDFHVCDCPYACSFAPPSAAVS